VADFKTSLEKTLLTAFADVTAYLPENDTTSLAIAEQINKAMIYPLESGGKRVRPWIVCLMAEACGTSARHPAVLSTAAALELVHTYSLVHDDLPCMDNDDFRRGKPTTHKVFGEANALLVGDALLTQAFAVLAQLADHGADARTALRCVEILSRNAGQRGMIAGQWLDLSQTNTTTNISWDMLKTIHNLKTGALLGCAFSLGLLVGCSLEPLGKFKTLTQKQLDELLMHAESAGQTAGLAFQIVDDVLDVTQNSILLGKTAGKDEQQNKLTAVKVLGLENATKRAEELTKQALNDIEFLHTKLANLSGVSVSSGSFQPIYDFVSGLFMRTS